MKNFGKSMEAEVPTGSTAPTPSTSPDVATATSMSANTAVGGNIPQGPGKNPQVSGQMPGSVPKGSGNVPKVSTGVFSPLNEYSPKQIYSMLSQQEPKVAETAHSQVPADLPESWNRNPYRYHESRFEQPEHDYLHKVSGSSTDSLPSSGNFWENSAAYQKDQMHAFDFLIKSVSAANNYVSMLNREQVGILKLVEPRILYDLLINICNVQNICNNDKRGRRVMPNECAFCKNNGENEENYGSHQLKDTRGVVLCPVLRAFRCPRCGATGDRAHTIKYCPETSETLRGGLSARRRSPLFMDNSAMTPGSASSSGLPTPSIYSSNFAPSLLSSTFTSMDTLFAYNSQTNYKETTAFGTSTDDSSCESTPPPDTHSHGANNQFWPFFETK